jgi:NAD(P)-dependent dehydrogenase (short-subunit alcohol dehydrogenase family)
MTDGLAGRTALVTGAGNGLGRSISLALGGAAMRVVAVSRTRENLEETARLMSATGASCRVACCDVSDPGAVTALANEVRDEDISVLINNAGIGGPVNLLCDIEPREWDEVFHANVRSVYLMCRAFLPAMIAASRGDIINIASVTGKRPLVRRTPYAASKMAVLGLTRTLSVEVGPLGVSVNSVSPGPVRGARMTRNFRLDAERSGRTIEETTRDFVSRGALNRLVEEDEVAAAVVATLQMRGLCGADIDLSAGMIAP